ncbi:MAG: copper chaperone PCu(A)C [Oceanicaulis sp.]
MTRLLAAASVLALSLAACGDPDEPGDINSNIEPGESGALADLDDEGAEEDAALADEPAPATMDSLGGASGETIGDFTLTNGWVRNPVGGRDVTAGFFTLQNAGADARLVGVTSPEAERVELHTMAMDGDVMRMREVEGYDVPACGTLALQSGGDHLMIFGLPPEAAADGELELVFTFEDGRTLETELPFSDTAPSGMSGAQGG